jgi:hypothetical protein
MMPLSAARLRRMAATMNLDLDDEELTGLLPMVQDLLAVAQRLRHEQSIGKIDRAGSRDPSAHLPG